MTGPTADPIPPRSQDRPRAWKRHGSTCKNTTMAEFARNLEQATGFFDHPIRDATSLQGGWNFMIGWSSQRGAQVSNPNPAGGATVDAADPGYLSAYDAVEKELGLKLVKQKRSIPVIVVDHVAEKPIE